MCEDLKVNFAGVSFTNPFIVGPCPSTRDADHVIEAARAGWSAAVTKSLSLNPPYHLNPKPFLASLKLKNQIIGLFNNESYTDPSINAWCDQFIPKIKKSVPSDFVLISSIMEGPEYKDWISSSNRLAKAGVNIIEMNVSCPHGAPEKHMGKYVGDDLDLLYLIVKKCVSSLNVPVLIKLSAESYSLADSAKVCEIAGAAGIVTTNTVLGFAGIDINTYIPKLLYENRAVLSGYSGEGIRPLALRAVVTAANNCNLPIIGVGGISRWEHAVEFFLSGAHLVQLATAVMLHGFPIIGDLISGTRVYLQEKKETVSSLRGKSLSYFKKTNEPARSIENRYAIIDSNICTKCELCIPICKDGSTGCISLERELILIDSSQCTGCGLCKEVCPFNAISIE